MGLSLFYKNVTSGSGKPMSMTERRRKTLDDIPTPRVTTEMSTGYRELSKNKTLAGRESARQFNGDEKDLGQNRLKMVSRLRHKEKFLAWRHLIHDLSRYVLTGLNKFNPARVLVPDPYEVSNSAVRFTRRK
ncbi:MAG: hypothetical protein SGJ27_21050 [Candidatus Melainabacteria bacterium]|nr:hypothetical protein [Candidatus Melainabacteria bacterium]